MKLQQLSDHVVHVSTGVALGSAVWPMLAKATEIAAFCSYVLSCVASIVAIVVGTPKLWRMVTRWWILRQFYDSDDEQL